MYFNFKLKENHTRKKNKSKPIGKQKTKQLSSWREKTHNTQEKNNLNSKLKGNTKWFTFKFEMKKKKKTFKRREYRPPPP